MTAPVPWQCQLDSACTHSSFLFGARSPALMTLMRWGHRTPSGAQGRCCDRLSGSCTAYHAARADASTTSTAASAAVAADAAPELDRHAWDEEIWGGGCRA